MIQTQKKEQEQAETKSNVENGAKTRIISTVMGEVEVPNHPERVVVDWYLGQVLALDLVPVGAPSTLTDYGKFLEPLVSDEMADIGTEGSVSMEKVLGLEPDLITTWDSDAYENYAKIAPTIVFSFGKNVLIIGDLGERGGMAAYRLLGLTPTPLVKS